MLCFGRYRFTLRAQDPIHLPPFPGSALRGVFGHGLKQSVCVTRLNDCHGCALRSQCVYSHLLETSLYTGEGSNAPQPLVLDPYGIERQYAAGAIMPIEITLIGDAARRHLPYVIQGWRRAGMRGLGREHANFSVERVDLLDMQTETWKQLMPQTDITGSPRPGSAPHTRFQRRCSGCVSK